MSDILFSDDYEEDLTGKVKRTKDGRPYILYNPDWQYGGIPESVNRVPGLFSEKPAEPRGYSKIYTRTTTYVSCLEVTYSLGQHQERGVVVGMASRPSYCARANAVDLSDEQTAKRTLNQLAEEARDAAGWNEKRELGTEFHNLAETYDRGLPISDRTTPEMKAMLAAYAVETEGWEYAHIEQGVVNDELGYYGTPDRLRYIKDRDGFRWPAHRPRLRVADIKTGRIDYGQQKMALQMAAYAIGQLYDPDTGIRTDLDIDLDYAEIVHVPFGEGKCTVYPVPLAEAINALTTLVPAVRKFRSKTTWFDAPVGPALRSGRAASWPSEPSEVL